MRLVLLAALFAAPAFAQTPAQQPRVVDFSRPDDLKLVQSYAAPGGVASGADVSLRNGALDITNRAPGSFGVQLNVTPLDVDEITDLTFDFKASPDARVNWFFRANGNYYGVHFTGPTGVRPGAIELGDAEITPGKDGWKRAHIPLRSWLRAAMPAAPTVIVDEILIGNWDNEGYLMAGIGGNGPGANWQMDDLKLEKRRETPVFGAARWDNQRFVLPARDLSSFDFSGLQLQIDGIAPLANASDDWMPNVGLVADVGAQNILALKDGESRNWKLTRGDQTVANGEIKLRYADMKMAPLPTLLLDGAPVSAWDDMELGTLKNWQSNVQSAYIEPDNSTAATAATGARSLRLTNKITASIFSLYPPGSIDATKFPALTFAYRTDDRVRVDLAFIWEKKRYSIRFLDRDNPDARVATIADVKADKSWHVATVNLLEALQKARPDAADFTLTQLQFADAGWTGNARAVQWSLDDWRPAPRVEGTLKAKIVNRDVSGLSGISTVFDQKTDTQPTAATSQMSAELAMPLDGKTGLWWLHVRARDGAGKWSETAHFPFWCGALPVAPVEVKPAEAKLIEAPEAAK